MTLLAIVMGALALVLVALLVARAVQLRRGHGRIPTTDELPRFRRLGVNVHTVAEDDRQRRRRRP